MSNNQYGLDNDYFERKIAILHRDGLRNWKPDELARELARMSQTADKSVMLEPEFETQVELAALREELATTRARENMLLNNPNNVFKQMCDMALKQRDEFAQRLTAAEQRNATLRGLLEEALGSVYVEARRAETPIASRIHTGLADRIEAALKPAESGASE